MKRIAYLLLVLLLLFLPLLPLEYAPVVPHPAYRLVWRAPVMVLLSWLTPLVGVSYRFAWGTLPVLLLLLAAVGWLLYRFFKM
ncbi:MAG TPA: hypothetical protein ENJ02_04600 [Chloroflexi bacterium]|nr:hypothetical protein [Chloroflexota bacterium]